MRAAVGNGNRRFAAVGTVASLTTDFGGCFQSQKHAAFSLNSPTFVKSSPTFWRATEVVVEVLVVAGVFGRAAAGWNGVEESRRSSGDCLS